MTPAAVLKSLEANDGEALYLCRHERKHRQATVTILTELLGHSNSDICHRAMNAIGRIRGAFDEPKALADVTLVVCEFLRAEKLLTRQVAVGVLHCIGHNNVDAASVALVAACKEDALLDCALLALVDVARASDEVVWCFHRFANHPQGKIRRIVMRGLGAIGASDEKSLSLVRNATDDRSKAVRAMAAKTLARLTDSITD